MEKRFTLNLFYMGLIAALIGVVTTGFVFHTSFMKQVRNDVENEGHLIAAAYDDLDSPDELQKFASSDLRITLIAPSGTVLYESAADASKMENHLNRPEVQEALAAGTGYDKRSSDTIGTEEYYYAIKVSDGNILRVSISAGSMFNTFESSIPYLMIVVFILLILAVILALIMTRWMLAPIKNLPDELGDMSYEIDENKIYPELIPFVKEIRRQRDEREEMRQEFTANVTHELKTPLTSISGYAELIENGMATDDDVHRFAGNILKESSRMQILINDIIKLSELDMCTTPSLSDDIDLYMIASDCADNLKINAENRNISINVDGTSAFFRGNKSEIWEMIYDLMDNAIRYNRNNGSVNIEISDKRISVKDTGIGIPEEHRPRIFERFYRVDKSHSRATGGTGLGLSIVKHIAEHHHARIQLESILNVGTTVTIIFP